MVRIIREQAPGLLQNGFTRFELRPPRQTPSLSGRRRARRKTLSLVRRRLASKRLMHSAPKFVRPTPPTRASSSVPSDLRIRVLLTISFGKVSLLIRPRNVLVAASVATRGSAGWGGGIQLAKNRLVSASRSECSWINLKNGLRPIGPIGVKWALRLRGLPVRWIIRLPKEGETLNLSKRRNVGIGVVMVSAVDVGVPQAACKAT